MNFIMLHGFSIHADSLACLLYFVLVMKHDARSHSMECIMSPTIHQTIESTLISSARRCDAYLHGSLACRHELQYTTDL